MYQDTPNPDKTVQLIDKWRENATIFGLFNITEHTIKQIENNQKHFLFLDVDDVILKSCEAVVEILNKRYNINPLKKAEEVKDWSFKSIVSTLKEGEIDEIFVSEEFWNIVKFNPFFYKLIINSKIYKNFVIVFVTHGDIDNLTIKKQCLFGFVQSIISSQIMPNDYCDMNFIYLGTDKPKELIDMSQGIQVDDNVKNFTGNAILKILLKNYRNTNYNQAKFLKSEIKKDLYEMETLEEAIEVLSFYGENFDILEQTKLEF